MVSRSDSNPFLESLLTEVILEIEFLQLSLDPQRSRGKFIRETEDKLPLCLQSGLLLPFSTMVEA